MLLVSIPLPLCVQDLSKRYASALLGLTNVAGSIPGIIGVTLVRLDVLLFLLLLLLFLLLLFVLLLLLLLCCCFVVVVVRP